MIKETMKENEKVKPNSRDMVVPKERFASCLNGDSTFDIENFKKELGEDVSISTAGHELDFLGKNYTWLLVAVDTPTVVVPDGERKAKDENVKSWNVYISGGDLDTLKHLLRSYASKVKCIYIDPSYNTCSDGFAYNNSLNLSAAEIAARLNLDEDNTQQVFAAKYKPHLPSEQELLAELRCKRTAIENAQLVTRQDSSEIRRINKSAFVAGISHC